MNRCMPLISDESEFRSFFGEYPVIAGSIRLTNACPLKCPHCYTNGGQKLKDELSTEEVKQVVDQYAELGSFYIFFTGGEPFLRNDIADVLAHTHNKGIGISLSTSGVGLRRETLEKIKDLKFNLFQISLDGDEDAHNKIRGAGMYGKALNAIRMAKELLGTNVGVGSVIMKHNSDVLDRVLIKASELGVDRYALMFLILSGRAEEGLVPSAQEHERSVEKVFSIYDNLDHKQGIQFAKNTTVLPALVPKRWREKGLHKRFSPCSFPYCLGVAANGDIAACDGFFNCREMILGNIREISLKEVWQKSKLMREILSINPRDLRGVCSKCTYRDYCAGGCRAYAYIKYRDLCAPDPICQSAYEGDCFPPDCLEGQVPAY